MKYVIQKSLSGIYEDNDLNRRLGRVGQKYNHSSGHIIIDSILISLKDEINTMVERSIDALQKQYDTLVGAMKDKLKQEQKLKAL